MIAFSKFDREMMDVAIEQALMAEYNNEVPVGAVLVSDDGTIIAKAHNMPIMKSDPTAHCEILVLRDAGCLLDNYRFPNTTLYVTLEPCIMCVGALLHARVSKVVFAAKEPKVGACGSIFNLHDNDFLNHKFEAVFMENIEYISILKDFFKKRRK